MTELEGRGATPALATPKLSAAEAERLIFRLYRHDDWKVYRTVGSLTEGVARAKHAKNDEDRLFVINDGRIVSWC